MKAMKALRISIAFVVVMGLWYLWDTHITEDSVWKYIALVAAAIAIYKIELLIVGDKK